MTLAADIRSFTRVAEGRAQTLADASTARVIDAAQARVPVDTGALKASVSQSAKVAHTQTITWDAPHAAAVEYGTAARPPVHFMTAALQGWGETVREVSHELK